MASNKIQKKQLKKKKNELAIRSRFKTNVPTKNVAKWTVYQTKSSKKHEIKKEFFNEMIDLIKPHLKKIS